LTPTQRDLLVDLAKGDDDVDRRELSRLRDRIRSIIQESPLLLALLPAEERRKVFDDLETYGEYHQRKWDKEAVTIGADGVVDEPEGPLSGHAMRPADEPDHVEAEGGKLRDGVIAALGFLYAGVDDTPTFEAMLEEAIRQSRLADGKIAVDVDVQIDMDREAGRDQLVEQWKAGEIEEEAMKSLMLSDPVALFEVGLSDEGEKEADTPKPESIGDALSEAFAHDSLATTEGIAERVGTSPGAVKTALLTRGDEIANRLEESESVEISPGGWRFENDEDVGTIIHPIQADEK